MANGIETRENHLVWNHRTSTTLGLLLKNYLHLSFPVLIFSEFSFSKTAIDT